MNTSKIHLFTVSIQFRRSNGQVVLCKFYCKFKIIFFAMALSANLSQKNLEDKGDLVAYWSVPLIDGLHTIEFEHGTTSGKRVLRIDGKV